MKHLTRKLVICAALLIGSLVPLAAQAGGSRGHHQSGIIGEVVWATWSPQPVQCLVDVETDSGRLITTVETDADGTFVVALKRGTYVLTPYFPQPSDATLSGPSVQLVVEKKDYTVVVMPFTYFDDEG